VASAMLAHSQEALASTASRWQRLCLPQSCIHGPPRHRKATSTATTHVTSADAAIALAFGDVNAFRIAASGGWDADADVRDGGCATSPGRAHDPARSKPTHRIMTERTRLKEHEKNRIS